MKPNHYFIAAFILGILALTVAAQTKIACVGTSITAGQYAPGNYPEVLGKLLGPGYTVANNGFGGITLASYLGCWMAPGVFTSKPGIITIELGTNDANKAFNRTTFIRDYNRLIDTFLTIPSHPRIYIVLPPPIAIPPAGYLNDTIAKAIVPVLQSIASQRGLSIIDLNTPFVGHTGWTTDGIHPNNAGNDTIAHIFYSVLAGGPVHALSSQNNRWINQYANGQIPKIKLSHHGLVIEMQNVNDGRSRAFLLNGDKKLTP